DTGRSCACAPGAHQRLVYLMSDEGELWSWDPSSGEFAFVVGPVCGGATPYSMAVDERGLAWVLFVDSMALQTFDVNDPGPCELSPYVRRNPAFGLFGTSFVARSETDACSDLYVQTYDGEGPFEEGPGLGQLGVIDPISGELEALGVLDYDGGELTGTGDGRLFAFTGTDPVKLVELDRATGAELDVLPLDGIAKTNASAVAFYGGDVYVFTEAIPAECEGCLESECGDALPACRDDATCAEHLQCVLETASFTDACGGGLSVAMMECVPRCDACLRPSRARVSQVLRVDLDGDRSVERVVEAGPIRVVGAASSPCVPVGPI
ncbi:MAG TPA: hypothetical protein RMH80_25520, partial [Polyangiaceae bacterium LLY-WYZ-15_(1-7)]|nr:hypothetical protein [Polyangiaceae bacterium LLY-WYZ-15_(1-7)]